ncbi:MAG TPA: hypothetical protein VFJ84_03540 [Candidatus Saccharimonadales bacterium]|nr:hypothetical protein [Candidatus Saccharimonadales bacterium]
MSSNPVSGRAAELGGEALCGSDTSAAAVGYDATPSDDVKEYFEEAYQRRVYNPLEDPTATERLFRLCRQWQAEGRTVIFNSGVYDLMHGNHRAFMLHTRMAGAGTHWKKFSADSAGRKWEDLSPQERADYTKQLLLEGRLKQVVSVRGNDSVAERKGNKPEKGGAPRPIYDWETRARDVMSASVEVEAGVVLPLADAVTVHDEVIPELAETPHNDIMSIAAFLQPDVWSLYFESQYIIDAIESDENGRFTNMDVLVLTGRDFYSDRLLGGPFTTTNITRRLGGSALNGGK